MSDRVPIPKKLRFEVFKRDKFTCQYCGGKAPDVLLHCDHMQPVAEGGKTEILNLITSCQPCNLGKGARLLSDDSVVGRQRAQMADLEERRQQLEMMMEWRNGLQDLDDDNAVALEQYLVRTFGYPNGINDYARGLLKTWLRKCQTSYLLEAIDAAAAQYIQVGSDGTSTLESRNRAFHMILKIATVRQGAPDKPYLKDLLYVRGIARNRFRLTPQDGKWLLQELEDAYRAGVSIGDMKQLARRAYDVLELSKELDRMVEESNG